MVVVSYWGQFRIVTQGPTYRVRSMMRTDANGKSPNDATWANDLASKFLHTADKILDEKWGICPIFGTD